MTQTRKVIKTGNSLALTIPSKSIKDFNIKEGDVVMVKINKSKASIDYIFSSQMRFRSGQFQFS